MPTQMYKIATWITLFWILIVNPVMLLSVDYGYKIYLSTLMLYYILVILLLERIER